MDKLIPRNGRMANVIVSLSTAVLLSGVTVAIPQIASALTIAEIQAQIASLTAQLNALIAQQGGQPAAGACTFTRSLTIGVSGADVKCLQQYLNSSGYPVASSGAGSAGNESMYFGSKTQAAVSKWQAANGVSPAVGFFGSISRAKYNSVVVVTPPGPTPPPTTTPPAAPKGTGLTVSAAAQPGDSLAPANGSRIKATAFTLTASNDGDIVVNSVTVERQGPAADSSVSSVIILDEDGLQIGLQKTLNSNHQALLSNKFTVSKGTSRTITVAINRPASPTDGGAIAHMAVVAIDAGSATVSGSLPIVGSNITMNSTLTIGSMTLVKGVNDPGSSQTKEIGTNGYTFTAIRGTAGSAEDLILKWVSFNQSGSAATTDIANVKVNVNGTDYPVTISSDGKYYTAKFGDGIALKKGNQAEIYVKGDVTNGSNRGVDFDLYRYTDLYIIGQSFGYGITPTATDSGDSSTDDDGTFQATNPVWDAYEATIGAGTLTVTASTAVPAQNIAVNLNDQPIGAFDVDVKGEAITVSSIVIRVSGNKNDSSVTEADYTDVKLVDNTTGKVVAGPKDGSGTTDSQMIFTFTDAVSFPVGKRTYLVKGKLSTDFDSDTLVSASTTPNSDWTSITGDTSGTSITAANTGTVSGNSYTVKSGAVNVSLSTTPQAQTVIRGAKAFTFSNIVFDGTNSGEDIRFTSLQVQHNYAVAGDVTNCQLFDGTTALNTGSNIVNPSAASAAALKDNTFTLDTNLTVGRGSSKNVALKCDISKSGTGAYAQWTFSSNETFGATGLTSGTSITPGVASSSVTNKMTFSDGGTLTIVLEPGGAASSVQLGQAAQEVAVNKLRFSAANEDVLLTQIALAMSNTASSSVQDVQKYTLWDGSSKVGEVIATSSTAGIVVTTGTCSGCSPLLVQNGNDKIITVKTQLSDIQGSTPTGRTGHLVTIDYSPTVLNGNATTYGVGQQSSANVNVTSAATASAGVRVVRSYPTVTSLAIPSSTLAAGVMELYRFSVSAPPAPGNGVSLYKVTFNIASSAPAGGTLAITSPQLFAFTTVDSNGNLSNGAFTSDGALNNGATLFSTDGGNDGINVGAQKATTSDYAIYFNPGSTSSAAPEAIFIPAGSTYYFQLKGNVSTLSNTTGTYQANVVLEGDRTWYGVGNTSGGTIGYDNTGFLAGAINYAFATTAPTLDQGQTGMQGGQGAGVVTAAQTWTNQPGAGANFIWSDNATTTHSGTTGNSGPDWMNGYLLPGLPTQGGTIRTLSASR